MVPISIRRIRTKRILGQQRGLVVCTDFPKHAPPGRIDRLCCGSLTTMGSFLSCPTTKGPATQSRFNFFELIISPLANQVRPDRRSARPTYPLLARFLNSMVSCAPFGTTPTEARRSVRTVTLMGPRRGWFPSPSPVLRRGLSRRHHSQMGFLR